MIKNIKIAHFIHDEKFPDLAYSLFETVSPGCNDFYIASSNKNLKYIHEIPVNFISRFAFKNPFFMRYLEKYNFIVLHSLTKFNQELVSHSNGKLKFVWIGMGFDYYDMIYDSKEAIYYKKTNAIAQKFDNSIIHNKSWLKELGKKIIYKNMCKKEVVKRINYFSPVLENEYNMLRERFNSKFPKYVSWNYGSPAELNDGSIKKRVTGHNILLGNSATLTNNHIEAMDFLKHIDLKGKKIICPLSYGNDEYGDYIASKGAGDFGDDFVSIRRFMPFDEYIKTINSCSNVIMNHLRQQAAGNVVAMLLMGAKVFLNKANPLYEHLVIHGVKLFTIEKLYKEPEILDSFLSEEDIERNIAIIISLYGSQTLIDKTRNLIEQVRDNV